jgi:nucleotide-binding universal stress UspA family protein
VIGILSPALQLIERAKREKAATLVVGSTRRGAIGRAMLGGTAKQIPQSKVALRRAEDLARQAGATIEVLVASDPIVAGIEAELPPDTPSSIVDVLEVAVASVDPALAPIDRFLLGSMTNHLITEAPCPVLVVPQAV